MEFMVKKTEEEKGICQRLENSKFSLNTSVKVEVMNGSTKRVKEEEERMKGLVNCWKIR